MANDTTRTPEIIAQLKQEMTDAYTAMHDTMCELAGVEILAKAFGGFAALAIGLTFILFKIFNTLVTIFALPIMTAIIKGIEVIRKSGSKELNALIVGIMGEFFGADFTDADIPSGTGQRGVRDRAASVGHKFHALLRDQFKVPPAEFLGTGARLTQPDSQPAETFAGFSIDFSVFTSILTILGEIESFGKIEGFRELGSEIARNLSLGRLQRLAQKPLIDLAVAKPLELALMRTLRPTTLSEGDILDAMHSGLLTEQDAHEELIRLGHSIDNINALVELRQKRVDAPMLERLGRFGFLTKEEQVGQLRKQGYTDETARLALNAVVAARLEAQELKDMELLRAHVVNGVLDERHLDQARVMFHVTEEEWTEFRERTLFQRDIPHKFLTELQVTKALESGVIDVAEFDDLNTRAGYSLDDRRILLQIALLALARQKEAAAVKAARAAAKAAKPKTPKKSALPPA